MSKKDKRFVTVHKEMDLVSGRQILVDKETGVNYLVVVSGYGVGVTPLLDRNGAIIVSATGDIEECK